MSCFPTDDDSVEMREARRHRNNSQCTCIIQRIQIEDLPLWQAPFSDQCGPWLYQWQEGAHMLNTNNGVLISLYISLIILIYIGEENRDFFNLLIKKENYEQSLPLCKLTNQWIPFFLPNRRPWTLPNLEIIEGINRSRVTMIYESHKINFYLAT